MILKNFRTIRGEIDLSQCTQFASDTYGLTQKLRNLSPDQIPSLCNEMICLEIFQYIKRCFCLHDEVKNFIFQYQTNTQTSKEDSFSKNESSTQEPTNFSLPFLLSAMVYCLNISKKLIQQSNRGIVFYVIIQLEFIIHFYDIFFTRLNLYNSYNLIMSFLFRFFARVTKKFMLCIMLFV
ncbi:hypothetical protein HZS_5917 [Henneguya salminicola]|nr:hypothetical protein HZS_5917 [Henneguya salminicola]